MYKSTFLAMAIFFGGFQFAIANAGEVDQAQFVASCDRLLAEQFHSDGPGATALIARDGRILYKKAFGMANIELQVPMQAENVFRIGSITKQFTAVAILQLVEQGKMDLQDEVTKFIPDYPTLGNKITIENLLTHTSGIQDYAKIRDTTKRGPVDFTPKEMIDYFKNRPMRFTPGTKWEYSNSNYFLLGYIIETITGKTYADYLESHIFKPLGMSNSYYASETKVIKNRADGYSKGEQELTNAEYLSMTQPYAAGAILSTVEDLFKWQQAVHSYKLITRESLNKALTRYTLSTGEKTNYGYGWRLGYIQNSPSIWHGGMINGFIAMEMYLPKEDVFVAVLSNCECNSPEDVTAKLAALAIGEPYDYKASILEDSVLSGYTGVYENSRGQQKVFTMAEHQLFAQSGRGPKSKVNAIAQDNFAFDDDLMSRIEFARGDRGAVESLITKSRTAIEVWNKTNKPIPSADGIRLDEKILQLYVGEYEVTPEFAFVVTKDQGRLFVKATGQETIEIFADAETRFFMRVNGAELEFVKDASGTVTKAILTQGGRTTEAKKVR